MNNISKETKSIAEMRVSVLTYTHTCTHTYIHTCTHTYKLHVSLIHIDLDHNSINSHSRQTVLGTAKSAPKPLPASVGDSAWGEFRRKRSSHDLHVALGGVSVVGPY